MLDWVAAATPPATAATSSGADPTLALLTGALAAAIVTLAGGFVGALIHSRREHARWVREQRLAAYTGYLSVAEQSFPLSSLDRSVWTGHVDSMAAALAVVRIVGPKNVADATEAHLDLALDYGKQARTVNEAVAAKDKAAFVAEQTELARQGELVQRARGVYVDAVQAVLGIPG